jgi:hypothetical protein
MKVRSGVAAAFCALGICFGAAAQQAPAAARGPSVGEVYDGHAAAYDRKDIDAFIAYFADDAVIYRFPDVPLMQGKQAIKAGFSGFWKANPDSVGNEIARIVAGSRVIERNTITGLAGGAGASLTSTQIVEIRNGLIQRIWVLSEP